MNESMRVQNQRPVTVTMEPATIAAAKTLAGP
jgi:hypothetical protein